MPSLLILRIFPSLCFAVANPFLGFLAVMKITTACTSNQNLIIAIGSSCCKQFSMKLIFKENILQKKVMVNF